MNLLVRTYPYYVDRKSRRAVQKNLHASCLYPPQNSDLLSTFTQETLKAGIAASNAFVLVEWGSELLQGITGRGRDAFHKDGAQIIQAHARALEMLLDPSLRAKRSLLKSALVVTRRALRTVLKSLGKPALVLMVDALTAKGQPLGNRSTIYLGTIAGVVARLKGCEGMLEDQKAKYFTFYLRELVGSRTPVPDHIASGLKDFFASFVSLTDLEAEALPALEKALLRAPEVVLKNILPSFLASISQSLDLSQVLAQTLCKSLLACLKSSNVTVRDGAVVAFQAALQKSQDTKALADVADEILGQMLSSKITAEQRALHAKILASIPAIPSRSSSLCNSLCTLLAKETSETALENEALALLGNFKYVESSEESLIKNIVSVCTKGLEDKRQNTKRHWMLLIGNFLEDCFANKITTPPVVRLLESSMRAYIKIFDEVMQNALVAAASGLAVGALIAFVLSGQMKANDMRELKGDISKAKLTERILQSGDKTSVLLNWRVFTKYAEADLAWQTRALGMVLDEVKVHDSAVESSTWAQAFIYLIAAPKIPKDVKEEAASVLKEIYQHNQSFVSRSMISGLWAWQRNVEQDGKGFAASLLKTGNINLLAVLQAICPPVNHGSGLMNGYNEESIKNQLIRMLVLCRQEIIPGASWINFCLRMGQDPGLLVNSMASECLEQIESVLYDPETSGKSIIPLACYNMAAELAFVAPDTLTPLLLQIIRADLPASEMSECGPIEVAITRTPEGTAFVDVLSNQNQKYTINKNAPDYETVKWEEEMRKQIARKTGQVKKYSVDEKAKVDTQLRKEREIRQHVQGLERKLRNGIGYVHGLAAGPPTDTIAWLGPSLIALTSIIDAGASRIVGSAANDAYIACAGLVTSRLGSLRPFIGIATLRALGAQLADDYEEEPLTGMYALSHSLYIIYLISMIVDQIPRILHRLYFLAQQVPFDSISLLYILPLLGIVLRRGGIAYSSDDEADEQLTLSLELLSLHADMFSSKFLPRRETLSISIELLQKYPQHFRLVKDMLGDLCRAIGDSISYTEELPVLLQGALVRQSSVRAVVLQAIRDHMDLTDYDFCEEIWLACHDDDAENASIADLVWHENGLDVEAADASKVLPYLSKKDRHLRRAASRALADCIQDNRSVFDSTLEELKQRYVELRTPRAPELDAYGMPRKIDISDPWEGRSGIALAFKEFGRIFDSSKVVLFFHFLVDNDVLGDSNVEVRNEMIESAMTIIEAHGSYHVEELMRLFKAALDASEKSTAASDLVGEALVILYGSLARHLSRGDERVPQVVRRLLSALSTPSENIQYAVAGCLPPLIRSSTQQTSEYIQLVIKELLTTKKYPSRRGAAYGLAGIIQGKGVSALQEYRILSQLKGASEAKKDANSRQAALLAYELMASILDQVFEPYTIQILPQLLSSFGDASADVRDACLDASKACFAHLSSYGVKIILPRLLEGLDDTQWRSKKGACDLLGAMAYLDPQQLAMSLPDIIPPLTNVLNDSHKEVRAAANRSLQRFGEVISNPEIKGLVGILLKALSDPTKYTDDALDALIKVSFMHYLDSPSLALIVRILERGLSDRSGTKRKASQIIGSLAHLTDRKDLTPHLPNLVSGLKLAIVDPVPSTRATASKALGSLVEKLGEDALPDLIPSLMSTLKSDTGAGDRLGSAQALSEVLAGLGTGRLEETLPSILQNASSTKATIREGFMSLFIYLPACFGNSFANYLSRIIPSILSGLADDIESIRETSLKAGRLLVKNFATKAIDLLLPELDRGLANDSYRIRLSSVELIGDLLFSLTGISGKTEQEEDEETGAAEAGQSLLEVLGEEKRNKVLSSLYICRYDTSGLVRTAAINVWKALVATPRTLKELVPTLTKLLIERLASSNMEQKVIAGNALGEFIRKAGEGVLATLLPTLENGLQTSTDKDNKQGICIALREIVSSASPDILEDYESTLISVVRVALADPDVEVREAAAEAFDSLQEIFGKKAVDQVLPPLLNLLRSESEATTALAALLTLLTDNTRSNIILPNLVPTLMLSPITAFNAKAIASLSGVAGPGMTRRLPTILNGLMDEVISSKDELLRTELEEAFDAVLLAADEFDGLNTVMSVMLAMVKNDDHRRRAAACMRLSNFLAKSEVDYSRYHQDLIRVLLLSFDDSDMEVVKAAWLALSELTKRLKKEEMESLVLWTRQIVQQVGVPGANLPGFSLPKGINAILPIFLQGLMNGTAEQRTSAALAISEMIDRSSAESLKPFVTQITGPLIRVISERSVDVKAAILLTLNNLLQKIPSFLKPFLPQLQRTFAKSLADTTSEVLRSRAAKALGTLITLTPRIDPLIAELVAGAKTADTGVQNAMLKALYEVVSKAGTNMGEPSRVSILNLIDSDATNQDDSMAINLARLLGALIKCLPPGVNTANLLKTRVLTSHLSKASVLSLNAVLLESPRSLIDGYAQETSHVICQGIKSNNTIVSENSVLAAGKFLLSNVDERDSDHDDAMIEALASAIRPSEPVDTRRLALVVIRTLCRTNYSLISPHLDILTLPVYASVRDIILPIKLAAEAALLAIFCVVDEGSAIFDKFITSAGPKMEAGQKRQMQDYFKRVAMRLGAQAREKKEAEGGQGGLGLSSDEREDEREVWSVGKVDLEDSISTD